MLLSLSSIFEDFFDTPEDDPLLQEDASPASSRDSSSEQATSEHESTTSHTSHDSKRDADGGWPSSDRLLEDASPFEQKPVDASSTAPNEGGGHAPRSVTQPPTHSHEQPKSQSHAADRSRGDGSSDAMKRTQKFVVPYRAGRDDLAEVNDALESGWSFQHIAVSEAQPSAKPVSKKLIITLEMNEPRSLFDF